MKTVIEPYLFFRGRCEEAVEFYESALGASRIMLMHFEEAPDQPPEGMLAPGWDKKVMHASIRIGETMVMMSDGCGPEDGGFDGFRLSLCPENEDHAKKFFAALSDGGSVEMPLGKTFWSPCYGMCTDKFGVGWMVNIPAEMP